MMAICKSALSQGNGQVTLLYANRDENSVIFADRPARAGREVPGPVLGRALAGIGAGPAERWPRWPDWPRRTPIAQVFICGPGPFMAAAQEALESLNVPAKQVHVEVFRVAGHRPVRQGGRHRRGDDGDEPPATAIVTLDGQTHEVSWPRNAKLLDVLLDKGLDAPFSCREGHCGACAVLMKTGEVDMEINDVLEQSDLDEGLILGCQALPKTDSVEVTYDE